MLIYYISGKNNSRVDALSRKSDHIEIREIFTYCIIKVNQDGLLFINKYKLNIKIRIIKDN